jgi:hypothetical protein
LGAKMLRTPHGGKSPAASKSERSAPVFGSIVVAASVSAA